MTPSPPISAGSPTASNGVGSSSTSLPIRDNPAYSWPSGSTPSPSRTSSDNRSSDLASINESVANALSPSISGASASAAPSPAAGAGAGAAPAKRQPRKLVKSRGNSDVGEKTKAVLTKKAPATVSQRNSALSLVGEDGVDKSSGVRIENVPFEGSRRASFNSQGSAGRPSST